MFEGAEGKHRENAEIAGQIQKLSEGIDEENPAWRFTNGLQQLDTRTLSAMYYWLNSKGINNFGMLVDGIVRKDKLKDAETRIVALLEEKNAEKEAELMRQIIDLTK